jgi:hypothetical protein
MPPQLSATNLIEPRPFFKGIDVGRHVTHDGAYIPPRARRHNIPDEIIEWVRRATRIEDVIGARIPLRRVGKFLVGSCPWHESKSGRSFKVYPDQQSWRCWGSCAIGGDVFTFLERFVGISFPAAVRLAGKLAGIEVDGNLSDEANERLSLKTRLRQVEARITEILEAEFLRAARELDSVNRLWVQTGNRLGELSTGSAARFANEDELCWSALQYAAAALLRLDAEFMLLGFGRRADREKFVAADSEGRARIIDEVIDDGCVIDDRRYRWEVPV